MKINPSKDCTRIPISDRSFVCAAITLMFDIEFYQPPPAHHHWVTLILVFFFRRFPSSRSSHFGWGVSFQCDDEQTGHPDPAGNLLATVREYYYRYYFIIKCYQENKWKQFYFSFFKCAILDCYIVLLQILIW